MQGQKSTINSVPENVDINVGPFPLTDSIAQQTYLSNRPNQEGLRSSSYASSSEVSPSSSHAVGSGGDSFNAWNFGQPSFAANWEGRHNFDGMKVEQDWPSSICTSSGAGPSSAARQLELHHNVLFPETAVSQIPPANHIHQNNPTAGPTVSSFPNLESEHGTSTVSLFGNSSHLSGSSSHIDGRTGGSSSSMAAWGSSSCKRKALEGTSGQSNPSASSSSIPQTENFGWPNETLPHGNSPDPMNSSPASSWNSPSANRVELLSTSTGLTARSAALEPFPPLGITMGMGTTVAPRSFDRRGSSGPQQEPFPFNLSSLESSRHPSGFSLSHGPGRLSSSFLDVRSTRAGQPNAGVMQTSQLNAIQAPQLPSNTPGYTWIGAQHSRSSNFAGSSLPAGSRDEANSGSMSRYLSETPVVSSAAEVRNMGQDPTSWDLAAGLTSHRQSSLPSSRRSGQSSTSRQLLPPFVTPRSMSREIRRVLEWAPWAPESFDGQNSHIPAPSSSSGSSPVPQLSGANSLGRRQQYHRPGFSADSQGDELLAMSESPLRALTGDVERRNRVIAEIRQVLSAMRRGENLRAEDYMIFEPLMFQGLAEIHDRHREMRLDVDNMSYEDLLELGERIGDVSTGLKEETIVKFLRRHKKQMPTEAESVKDLEPCCICQEQYVDGEEMGELDCGHDFHENCIKQWLMHKNLCPICKTTGLVT